MSIPKPRANQMEYRRIMERGFERFPERKKNFENFLSSRYLEVVDVVPIKMDYEVASRCNFRCKMCLMSILSEKRAPNMLYEDFESSIKEQYGLIEVKLQGLGEPLLNPDFFKMVELAVSRDIWVRTTTNASLLHVNDNYKKLIDYKIGEIAVSIDGASKSTFEEIRTGSNFEQVVANATMLNEYAKSKGEQWRTSCWMCVQKDNYNEIESILELAERMKFTRFTYSIAIGDWGGEMEEQNSTNSVSELFTNEVVEHLVEKGRELGIEVTFWDDTDKYVYNDSRDRICDWLFSRAFISADMKIVPCCELAYAGTCCLGDARGFSDAWNNEHYRNLRKAHLVGEIPQMCRGCYK